MFRQRDFNLMHDTISGEVERVDRMLNPHPMAFFYYYCVCLFMIAMGIVLTILYTDPRLASQLGLSLIWQYPLVRIGVWWLILLTCGLVASHSFISWVPLAVFSGLALAGSFVGDVERSIMLIGAGSIGMILTESYRRAHRFYITDCRCVFVRDWLFVKNQRHITYEDISDVIYEKGVLGHVFDFGTVIPITPSGMGRGEDAGIAGVGVGARRRQIGVGIGLGRARSVIIPRTKSYFCFYKVPDPEAVQALVMSTIHEYQQTPWLRRIAEEIRGLRTEIGILRPPQPRELQPRALAKTRISKIAKCSYCHQKIDSDIAYRCTNCGALFDQNCAKSVRERGQCPFCKVDVAKS